ncbi:MAG: universal stress protein, partial [Waterburya sp.]
DLSGEHYELSRQRLQKKVETSKDWLETLTKKAEPLDISCKHECLIGNCNLGIGDRAKEWGADLIVIGRRGYRNISEMFLGSVSNYVIHHAPCSVLVVQGSETLETDELTDELVDVVEG